MDIALIGFALLAGSVQTALCGYALAWRLGWFGPRYFVLDYGEIGPARLFGTVRGRVALVWRRHVEAR